MHTVLLVDDEPVVLEALTEAFHWNQYGIDTLLTAHDGKSALEIISSQNVDLLITDILMPNMDGLSLLKQVRTSHPDTHCIILTAYSEFEYARTALKLGVDNYLLKPLVIEELEETIENAINNIYIQKKNSKHLFLDNLLLRWVNGDISGEALSERCLLLDINIYLPEYCILCIQKKNESVSLSAFCRICAEQLTSKYEIQLFKDPLQRYIFIIGGRNIQSEQVISLIKKNAEEMNLASFMALSMGNIVKNADHLAASYQNACHLIESIDCSIPEMHVLPPNTKHRVESDLLLHKINTLFHQDDEVLFQNNLHELVDELYLMTEADSVLSVPPMLVQCLERLFRQNFPAHPDAPQKIHDYIPLVLIPSNREAFSTTVMDLLKNSRILYNYYFKLLNPIIQLAIQYIHKHYAEDISIQSFCTKHKITPAYLGYLFRTETGVFMNNYLTQHRLHCSIHLLINTNLSVNDIAQKVGFSYSSYYISCFKKLFGISPNRYRTYNIKE